MRKWLLSLCLVIGGIGLIQKPAHAMLPIVDVGQIGSIGVLATSTGITVGHMVHHTRGLEDLAATMGGPNPQKLAGFYQRVCPGYKPLTYVIANGLANMVQETEVTPTGAVSIMTAQGHRPVDEAVEGFLEGVEKDYKITLPNKAPLTEELVSMMRNVVLLNREKAPADMDDKVRYRTKEILGNPKCPWTTEHATFNVLGAYQAFLLSPEILEDPVATLEWANNTLYSGEAAIRQGLVYTRADVEKVVRLRLRLMGINVFNGVEAATAYLKTLYHPTTRPPKVLATLASEAARSETLFDDWQANTLALKMLQKQTSDMTALAALQAFTEVTQSLNATKPTGAP